ncbi:MAG: SIS domain-containing protein [Streptococcus sp.]
MMKARSRYYQHIHDILNNIVDSQKSNYSKAALEMTQCIEKGHTIYAFGASCGNSYQELFYRAGGLALINQLWQGSSIRCKTNNLTRKWRDYLVMDIDFRAYANTKEDVLIIHSVSGRNTIAIDMALRAKAWV